jgi:uncharacterized repeat protein (TIGR01451 family)
MQGKSGRSASVRRGIRVGVVTVVLAILGFVTASAASPLSVRVHDDTNPDPTPPPGAFVLPAGATATFSSPRLAGCNNLTGGYRLNGGDLVTLVSKPYDCEQSYNGEDVTIGPYLTDQQLLVVLEDDYCERTYNSDDTPVDHVNVDGSNPWTVRFADTGGNCERPGPFTDFNGGNFTVGLTIQQAPAQEQITLSPSSGTETVGDKHTLTAEITQSGQPVPQRTVTFDVTDGPNAGLQGRGVTGADGTATFTYSSSKAGTDTVTASFLDLREQRQTSNPATVGWVEPAPPPPPPTTTTTDTTPPAPPKADVSVSVAGPSYGRVGQRLTYTVSIANAGPDTATGITLRATIPAGATLVSASESRGNGCSGSTCAVGTLASGAAATVTLVLEANQTGTFNVTARAESDYDPDGSNNTSAASTPVIAPGAAPPAPAPPSQPGTFNAVDVGTVLVNGVQRPADQLFQLKAGDSVDVTNGTLVFTTSDGSSGAFSSSQPPARRRVATTKADNLPAVFTVDQATSGGVTTLTLTGADFSSCSTPRRLSAKNQTPIRQLWGSAKGNFQTKGRYAAATVRGTIWLVQDRCDGTLTQVVEGVVEVADSTLGKTVSVPAGQSYVAPAAAAFKPPAARLQTAAQIKRNGLKWAGKVFKTKASFSAWLSNAGSSWQGFARAHPVQAKALAARS